MRLPAEAGDPVVVEVAGRANLIGEHTDYQGGLALPFALEGMSLRLEGRRLPAGRVRLTSKPDCGPFVDAVLAALADAGHPAHGVEGTITTSLPVGAGLSSSAALAVALTLVLANADLAPVALAGICQHAENDYVGVPCGLLDPLAIVTGRAGHASLIDFAAPDVRPVRWPGGLRVVIVHSGVERRLADGAYANRRRETEQAARSLGVPSLRRLAVTDLDTPSAASLPPMLLRRARHVVGENERVTRMAAALETDDRQAIGALLEAAHQSLSRNFEVSIQQIDDLVEALAGVPGVVGARLTGGGFGGCVVAVADAALDEEELDAALAAYAKVSGKSPCLWVTRPGEGVALEP